MTRTLRLAAPALALLLAAPAAAQTITGKVLPPSGGKAMAFDKVQVELAPSFMDHAQALRRLEGKPVPPLANARPRPDGSFEIAAPEPGLYRVTVRAEGFVPARYDLRPHYEEIQLPPVELEPASPLEIQILGPDGNPLAGALVMTGLGYMASPWQPAESLEVTGPNGRVTLPGSRGSAEVVAFSPRFGWQHAETGARAVTLRFKAPKLLTLEVRGARGKKIAGALVRSSPLPIPIGLTGPDGRLALPLPEHEMPLLVETADGQAALVRIGPESTGPYVAELAPPVTLSGKVLRADRRGPMPGALVWSGETRPVRAGEDGGFRIQVSAAYSQGGLVAAAPGYLPDESTVSLRSWEGGVPGAVTLQLSPSGLIAGRVVDSGGRPVAAARIRLQRPDTQLQSGPDGSFQLPRLRNGETYEVQVRKEGFAPASVYAQAAPRNAPAAPVRVVLSRGAVVFGRTVGEDGQPVAGATVELYPWVDPMRGRPREGEPAGTAASGTDGKFEVRNLPAGIFVLQARGDGFAPGYLRGVEIVAGAPRVDAGTVTLSPSAVFEGQVTDPRGAPIAGARVWAFPERHGSDLSMPESDRRPLEVGTDGRFRIDDLPRGAKIRVQVDAQGYGNASLEGLELPLPEPLRIELRPLVQLTGRVTDPEGEPVSGASLTRFRRRGNSSYGQGAGNTDGQGRFRIEVEPGPVEIRVRAEGYTQSSWSGTVPERGDAGPVEIMLRRGAVLEGRVLDPEGNPVAEAFVHASPEASSGAGGLHTSGSSQSDGEGRYRIAGLETGSHQVSVQGMGSVGQTSTRFEVQPGSNRLDLTLDAGVEVSGFVRDADGAPVAGAEVMLSTRNAGRSIGRQSAADGSFRFPVVTDGPYRVTARRRGSGFAEQEIEVAGRPVQGLELRLGPAGAITGRLLGLEPADYTGVRVGARATFREEPGSVRPDGTYRIPGLPPGEWDVFAELPSSRRADGRIRLEPGMTEAVLDLDLGGDLSLSGVVRIDGAPHAGIRLGLGALEGRHSVAEASTSAGGTFRITRVAPGAYHWTLQGGETTFFLTRQIELSTDLETAVDITTGTVRGQILSPEGAPVAGAWISLTGAHQEWSVQSSTRTDPQGRFELRLPAGEYRMTAQIEDVAGQETRLQVPAGRATSVQIVFQPASVGPRQ